MTLDELKTEVADILGMEASEISDETSHENVAAWDSMATMQILSFLDDAIEGEIEPGDVDKCTSFAGVTRLAAEHGALSE